MSNIKADEHSADDNDPTLRNGRSATPPLGSIPQAVVKRLSMYSRMLQDLELANTEKVSSQELAQYLGLNSAQVRKDLAYFGQFGVPGLGYYVADLRANLKKILGTDREIRVVIVGVGNLGTALMSYGGFSRQGFRILMAFDADRRKVGSVRNDVPIYHMDDLHLIADESIDIAVLTVPAEAAQEVADALVKAGIKGILNFVPQRLKLPKGVKIHYVDLAIEIESLSYYLR